MKRPLVEPGQKDSPAEEIHIIPLGWEDDRASLPFFEDTKESKRVPVHRAYIVVPDAGGARGFHDRVKKRLEKICETHVETVERIDKTGRHVEFENLISKISQICAAEIGKGNRVHINMSAGSKIGGLAAGLAGMAYIRPESGSIYYVEPEKYLESDPCEHCGKKPSTTRPLSKGIKSIRKFEPISLDLPDRTLIRTLAYVGKQADGTATFSEILLFLASLQEPGFQGIKIRPGRRGPPRLDIPGSPASVRMKLLRQIVHPLLDGGFIRSDRRGRDHVVVLQPRGRAYARFTPQ